MDDNDERWLLYYLIRDVDVHFDFGRGVVWVRDLGQSGPHGPDGHGAGSEETGETHGEWDASMLEHSRNRQAFPKSLRNGFILQDRFLGHTHTHIYMYLPNHIPTYIPMQLHMSIRTIPMCRQSAFRCNRMPLAAVGSQSIEF